MLVPFVKILAQGVPGRLVHELTEGVMMHLYYSAIPKAPWELGWEESRTFEKEHAKPDSSVVLLLVNYVANRTDAGLLAAYSAEEKAEVQAVLLKYFSPADLAYMQQQLVTKPIIFYTQQQFQQPWIRVLPSGTLHAMYKRLNPWERNQLQSRVAERYRTQWQYVISRLVFARNHRSALVTIQSSGGPEQTYVFKKVGNRWCKKQELQVVMHD